MSNRSPANAEYVSRCFLRGPGWVAVIRSPVVTPVACWVSRTSVYTNLSSNSTSTDAAQLHLLGCGCPSHTSTAQRVDRTHHISWDRGDHEVRRTAMTILGRGAAKSRPGCSWSTTDRPTPSPSGSSPFHHPPRHHCGVTAVEHAVTHVKQLLTIRPPHNRCGHVGSTDNLAWTSDGATTFPAIDTGIRISTNSRIRCPCTRAIGNCGLDCS